MFFSSSKPQLIMQLSRNELALYDTQDLLGRVPIPREVVQNLEVQDAAKLTALTSQLVAGQRGKRIVLILNASIVFEAAEKLDSAQGITAVRQGFVQNLPLAEADQAIIVLESKKQYFLFGTSKKLYATIVTAVAKQGCKVIGVVPARAYGLDEPVTLEAQVRQEILTGGRPLEIANFLSG